VPLPPLTGRALEYQSLNKTMNCHSGCSIRVFKLELLYEHYADHKHDAMKKHGGGSESSTCLIWELDGSEWSSSLFCRFTAVEKCKVLISKKPSGVPRSLFGRLVKRSFLYSAVNRFPVVQPVASHFPGWRPSGIPYTPFVTLVVLVIDKFSVVMD
jgi:hypothetical protein